MIVWSLTLNFGEAIDDLVVRRSEPKAELLMYVLLVHVFGVQSISDSLDTSRLRDG